MTTPTDKEQAIKNLMDQAGMTRERAEFVLAIESGEIEGDVIVIEDKDAAQDS